MSPLDDNIVFERIFDKLDTIDTKIDNLCDRMTKVEVTATTHLESEKDKSERKNRVFYVVMTVFGGIVSLIEVFRLYVNG